jgi:hypothetical protein
MQSCVLPGSRVYASGPRRLSANWVPTKDKRARSAAPSRITKQVSKGCAILGSEDVGWAGLVGHTSVKNGQVDARDDVVLIREKARAKPERGSGHGRYIRLSRQQAARCRGCTVTIEYRITLPDHTDETRVNLSIDQALGQPVRVAAVSATVEVLDFNHPLAGLPLTLDVKILDVEGMVISHHRRCRFEA